MANIIEKYWRIDGRPEKPIVLEPGAGKGYLAHDILSWLSHHGEIFQGVKYLILEKSEAMRLKEREVLEDYLDRVAWIDWDEKVFDADWTFVISNEFFDVLPFNRVVRRGDFFKELCIDYKNGQFEEVEMDVSSSKLEVLLKRYLPYRDEGDVIEVMPDIPKVVGRLGNFVKKGYFLTFDYGYWRSELLGKFKSGTLTVYHRHAAHNDPFDKPGEQDITAHVDFTLLEESLEDCGFETIFRGYQGRFLVDNGITQVLDDFQSILTEREVLKARLAMKSLVYDFGSVFKVLFARLNP